MSGKKKKTVPVTGPSEVEEVNEKGTDRLEMVRKDGEYTIDDMVARWKRLFTKVMAEEDVRYKNGKDTVGGSTTMARWNQLNPFLANQRLKNLFSQPSTYSKQQLGEFLASPGNSEPQLRSAAWANSSSQQIYYNMLRRSCDIPLYNWWLNPPLLKSVSEYKTPTFLTDERLAEDWLKTLNVPLAMKTIALQVKREGKQSYLVRSRIDGEGVDRHVVFASLEKMPTNWTKITGIGQLGYTVSFDMMYFMDIANDPSLFGDYMVKAWEDIIRNGVVVEDSRTHSKVLNLEKARNYQFSYNGQTMTSMVEIKTVHRRQTYLFWLRIPYDICFTIGSDNSHPWVAPDTMGLLMKLQELTDYGTLAGLIASTPLTAILTGEAEFINDPRAGKNETVLSPETLMGLQDLFNATTSTNVEAMFFPLKNIKLQQLSADVNSSQIISEATENFVETAGEGGLTITTNKPNVSQIHTAQLLAAEKENYVTLQMQQILTFIIQHKLGLKYQWEVKLWGDVFTIENVKKYLAEQIRGGNSALLPKYLSAEGMTMRNTEAVQKYLESKGIYDNFHTLTSAEKEEEQADAEKKSVGRPALGEGDIENDATAASRDAGTNTRDNREQMDAHLCPVCHENPLEGDQVVCDDCAQRIIDENSDN